MALLSQGVLQQVGSPKELYQHPSNLFTAGFIGSLPMNFTLEPLGAEVIVDIKIGESGRKVWLSFKKGKIFIFDKKSGKALSK